jgi:hypothetical protein
LTALKNIQTASLSEWRAAAWFLTHSIQGRYLNSARATKPQWNVADIARDLDGDDPAHQSGRPIEFRSCGYCGMEFEIMRRNQRFCSKECRYFGYLEQAYIRNRGGVSNRISGEMDRGGLVGVVPGDDDGGGLMPRNGDRGGPV